MCEVFYVDRDWLTLTVSLRSDPIAAVMNFLRPAAPLVAPPAASLLTFGIGLTAAQVNASEVL